MEDYKVSKKQIDISQEGHSKVFSVRMPKFLYDYLYQRGKELKIGHTQYARDLIESDYLKHKRKRS